jgi:hypothetical protein
MRIPPGPSVASLLVAALIATGAAAQESPAILCKDGTTSTAASGKGACSHHGGVAKTAADSAQAGVTAAGAAATKAATNATNKTPTATNASTAITCADGTTSTKSGQGACSHHGGVAKNAAGGEVQPTAPPAPQGTPPTRETPPTSSNGASSTTQQAAGASTSGNPHEDNNPNGAIARCNDGLYSHSTHHQGACSGHGGVAQWLDQP